MPHELSEFPLPPVPRIKSCSVLFCVASDVPPPHPEAMSAPLIGPGATQPPKHRIRRRTRIGLIPLVGFSAVNVFVVSFIIPKFERIYQDALPGTPLPALTQFFFSHRILLAIVPLAWTLVGIVLVKGRKSAAIPCINLGLFWNCLQTVTVIVALFTPLFGPAGGLSDAPETSTPSSPPDNNSAR
jgi:hypothetical protein